MIYTDFRRLLANFRLFVYSCPFPSLQASGAGFASFGYTKAISHTAKGLLGSVILLHHNAKDLAKITSDEWEAFLDDFQQTFDKFVVPAREQAELKAIVNSTRSDTVVDSAPRAASEKK